MSGNGKGNETFYIKLNGREVEAHKGETILEVARRENIGIPTLCYNEAVEPYGGCRLCVVEAKVGGRMKIVASCNFKVSDGLEVETDTDRVHRNRKMSVELHLAKCPEVKVLRDLAKVYNIKEPRFPKGDDDGGGLLGDWLMPIITVVVVAIIIAVVYKVISDKKLMKSST